MIQRWYWAPVRVSSQGLRLGRVARRAGQGERCGDVFKQAALRVVHRFRPAGRRHSRDPLIPGEEYRAGRQPEER
jgi:hypothetical protein